jgi:hypothetical protein
VTVPAITYPDIAVGRTYKWRARTVNETTGLSSGWEYFNGEDEEVDFEVVAQEPELMNPEQYETDEQTPIATGGETPGDEVVIKTQIQDPNPGEQRLRVRIEVKEPTESFDGESGIYESDVIPFTTLGVPIEVAVPITQGLKYETDYKWRVQIINEDTGLVSDWIEYGGNGDTEADFTTPAAVDPEPPVPPLTQYEADGETEIPEGGVAGGTTIVIEVGAEDPNAGTQMLQVEVEIVEVSGTFEGSVSTETAASIITSDAVPFSTPGAPVLIQVPVTGLTYEGQYKWRARITNIDTGLSSPWTNYGADPQETTVDVEIPAAPTPTPSNTPTPTLTLTPTLTPVPSPTGPTPPPLPLTNTPVPSATPVPPTATSVPAPIYTQGPTHTPAPTNTTGPTATPQPPTATLTPTPPAPLVNTGIPVTVAIVGGIYFLLSLGAIQVLFRE